jgi:putative transposase
MLALSGERGLWCEGWRRSRFEPEGFIVADESYPDDYKTCQRYNAAGDAHALTFNCFQRRPFLSKDRSRRWLVRALEISRERHGFDLWAWCIMPEHVHLLIYPPQADDSISAILKTIKQSVTRVALKYVREEAPDSLKQFEDRQPNGSISYRFWQRGGGYDRNVTEPRTIFAEIDYIHANPVRRGLCQRSVEWRWSSAQEYAKRGSGELRLDFQSLPRTDRG